jgi:hypothetical protein
MQQCMPGPVGSGLSLPRRAHGSPFGGVCGVCGVGLLFENYIVDASIL